MKLLYAYRYGIVGGVSTQLLLRQRALKKVGIECELFFSQDNGLRQLLPSENQVHFGSVRQLRKLVRDKEFDAVIVIDSPDLLGAAAGSWRKRNSVYLDVHTTTQTGLSYLDSIDVHSLAGVMVPSAYSKQLVVQRCPGWTNYLHIIPNIIDSNVFTPLEHRVEPTILSASVREFIWVGKLDHHKNWRLALVYARLLKDLFEEIRLTVVGGYTAPATTAKDFFQLAHELEINDSLVWLDRVENVQLAELYRRCADTGGAMLVTSRDESFGMAAAEALLCGCPLITNDLPVFREVFPESNMLQRVDIWQPEQVALAAKKIVEGISQSEKSDMRNSLHNRYGAQTFISTVKEVLQGAAKVSH